MILDIKHINLVKYKPVFALKVKAFKLRQHKYTEIIILLPIKLVKFHNLPILKYSNFIIIYTEIAANEL